ncbi:hypothetical protein IWQ62_004114 [Dispira parvispora]|uniref:Major facilitator superfamily (MFS) profile domain-containing protein n=1 Tax=Dispira parvispora TaxID=1520584 RepID=A0A9W8AN16_9FUNG|nr:hypothetical protein IWQ62_004114 [Dispira parvispora]
MLSIFSFKRRPGKLLAEEALLSPPLAATSPSGVEQALLAPSSPSHTATVDTPDKVDGTSVTWYALFVALVIALGSLQFGYHNGELNTPREAMSNCDWSIPSVSDESRNNEATFPPCLSMSDDTFSLATSIFTVGGLVGSLLAPTAADRWGRKCTTLFNNAFYLFGTLAMALATNVTWLVVGRFIVGVGSGISIVVCPMYLTEIAPLAWRGTFGLFNQMGIVLGILITQALGYVLNNVPGWRFALGGSLVFSVMQIIMVLFCVESPKYLAGQTGQAIQARAALSKLRGSADVDQEMVSWRTGLTSLEGTVATTLPSPGATGSDTVSVESGVEDAQLLTHVSIDRKPRTQSIRRQSDRPEEGLTSSKLDAQATQSLNFWTLVRSRHYRPALLLALCLLSVQQWSGINTVFFYSTTILAELFPGKAGLITVLINVCNLLATILSVSLVDRWGRRPLLLTSMTGMACALFVFAFAVSFAVPILSLVGIFSIVATFAVGLGPLSFLLAVELVDTKAAAVVSSLGLAANWLSNFAVSSGFLILNRVMGGWVYLLFVSILVATIAGMYFKLPETKDKSTQEIWRDMGLVD